METEAKILPLQSRELDAKIQKSKAGKTEGNVEPKIAKKKPEIASNVPEAIKCGPEVVSHQPEREITKIVHLNNVSKDSSASPLEDKASKPEVKQVEAKVVKPGVVKPETVKPEVVKPEPVKPKVVKHEPVKPEVVKPEPVKPEVVKPEPVKPEVVKPEPVKPAVESGSNNVVESDFKAVSEQQAVVKPETATEAERNQCLPVETELTSSDYKSDDNTKMKRENIKDPPNTSKMERLSQQERGTSKSTSGHGKEMVKPLTRTRRSMSNDSDSEISEILRNAPPPSVLPEEDDEEDEVKEEPVEESSKDSDEVGATVVIMKKTFTESIMPGHEFIPIPDDLCSPNPIATPPHRLEHPIPSSASTTAANKHLKDEDGKETSVSSTGKTDSKGVEDGKEGEGSARHEDDKEEKNILSKAQNEARDLTSEFRRLQYLLENLSSFTDLEIASFLPDSSSAAVRPDPEEATVATDTVAKEEKDVTTEFNNL